MGDFTTLSGKSSVLARRPLKVPLKSPLSGSLLGSIQPLEPRFPCMKCGKRPSELIVGPGLGEGWLCHPCYVR